LNELIKVSQCQRLQEHLTATEKKSQNDVQAAQVTICQTRAELSGKLRANGTVFSRLLNVGSDSEEVTWLQPAGCSRHGPRRSHRRWTDVSRGRLVQTSTTSACDAESRGPPRAGDRWRGVTLKRANACVERYRSATRNRNHNPTL